MVKKSPEPKVDEAASTRVIKKYPNRRLYDSASSSYITLTDIKQWVIDGVPLQVVDAKTSQDLTRSILLQIILEEEACGSPLFTEAALADMIRFYGHTMQTHMGSFIEKNMHMLKDMVGQYNAHVSPLPGNAAQPFAGMQPPAVHHMISGYLEQSQKAVAQMQAQMQEHMGRHTEQMLAAMGLKR
jgi:polyhydroxyalkanoate synthesis repressor PhaR